MVAMLGEEQVTGMHRWRDRETGWKRGWGETDNQRQDRRRKENFEGQ